MSIDFGKYGTFGCSGYSIGRKSGGDATNIGISGWGIGSDSELIKEFQRLNSFDFEGSVVPGEEENWLRCIERTFKFMNVAEDKKVLLAYYNLKGDALYWWEAIEQQLVLAEPNEEQNGRRENSWETLVKNFNDRYCPESYRMGKWRRFCN